MNDQNEAVKGGYMVTFTGVRFYPLHPNPAAVEIIDIAQALSNYCRWGGHVNTFMSVAEHSVAVSHLCDPEDAMIGLLHDAAEAYIGDVIRPLKYLPEIYKVYKPIETAVTQAIADSLKMPSLEKTTSVERADEVMLASEYLRLRPTGISDLATRIFEKYPDQNPYPIKCLAPAEARRLFLDRFYELYPTIEVK
jgi:5'-nucleotidase